MRHQHRIKIRHAVWNTPNASGIRRVHCLYVGTDRPPSTPPRAGSARKPSGLTREPSAAVRARQTAEPPRLRSGNLWGAVRVLRGDVGYPARARFLVGLYWRSGAGFAGELRWWVAWHAGEVCDFPDHSKVCVYSAAVCCWWSAYEAGQFASVAGG